MTSSLFHNKKSLSIWEKKNLNQYGADFFHQVYEAVKKKAISVRKHNFHILSEVFDDEPRTVFIDAYHISEAGNDKIADLMIQVLLQVIDVDKPKVGRGVAFPRTDR